MKIEKIYALEQEKLFNELKKKSLSSNGKTTPEAHHENILKNYLRGLIPSQLTISSGSIASQKDNGRDSEQRQSRQIDGIIFDKSKNSPLLESEKVPLILPQSVFSCIEVKNNLTFFKKLRPKGSTEALENYPLYGDCDEPYRWEGTLIDSLLNIKTAADVCNKSDRRPFMGIIANNCNFKTNTLFSALDNEELQRQLGIKHLKQLPLSICIPGKFAIVFSHIDIFNPDCHPDESTSFYYENISFEGFEHNPLQVFSVLLQNNIDVQMNKNSPVEGGLFTAFGSEAKIRSMNFDLSSQGEPLGLI